MPPEGIRLDSFMLADAASTFGGKLYVHGGGWNRLTVYDPSAARPITIVGRAIVPKTDTPQKYFVEIHMRAAIDGVVVESHPLMRLVLDPFTSSKDVAKVESSTPFVIDIPGIVFGDPGEYEFVATSDGVQLATSLLHVEFVDSPQAVAISAGATPLGGSEDDAAQWTVEARYAWARTKLREHHIAPEQGVEESELDYRERLIREIAQRGYVQWDLTPEGAIYLFSAQRPLEPSSSPTLPGSTSVTGAGRTAEEAMLMTLAIILDMMDR